MSPFRHGAATPPGHGKSFSIEELNEKLPILDSVRGMLDWLAGFIALPGSLHER